MGHPPANLSWRLAEVNYSLKRVNGLFFPDVMRGNLAPFRGERRTNSLLLQAKGEHNCQRQDKMEVPT